MRLRASLAAALILASALDAFASGVHSLVPDPGSWPRILGSAGFDAGTPDGSKILIARPGGDLAGDWIAAEIRRAH